MSEKLDPDEVVLRIIVRKKSELTGDPFSREIPDDEDFQRKLDYQNTGLPEFGMSFMRKCKFDSAEALYDHVNISKKKAQGIAETKWSALEGKPIKYSIGGKDQEHISLHCEDCDLVLEKNSEGKRVKSCSPKNSDSCTLFTQDPLDLRKAFVLTHKPEFR